MTRAVSGAGTTSACLPGSGSAARSPCISPRARARRSSLILKGRTLAPEHGRRTLTGLRCEYRWEAPVRPEPGARAAAAGLRASRADRERVIDLLKAAFVQGRLDRDEFDERIGQALASRTHGELAA